VKSDLTDTRSTDFSFVSRNIAKLQHSNTESVKKLGEHRRSKQTQIRTQSLFKGHIGLFQGESGLDRVEQAGS